MTASVPRDGRYGGPGEIQQAWRRLAGGSEQCAETLLRLATSARSEMVQAQAAKIALGIVGLGERIEVAHRVVPQEFDEQEDDGRSDEADAIRKRLAEQRAANERRLALAQRQADAAIYAVANEEEVVEAEIVRDDV